MPDPSITPSSVDAPVAVKRATLTLDDTGKTSCSYHRLTLPFASLDVSPKVPVFVFNRHPACGIEGLLKLRANGVRIVADIDDHWQLDPTHYLFNHYRREGITKAIASCVALADIVTVTNEALADEVRALNTEIVIVPNALPFDTGQFVMTRAAGAKSFFVYAAGASHCDDMIEYRAAFEQNNVTIAGVSKLHPEWLRVQKNFPKTATDSERPVTDYMRVYDGHSVALAPLMDTRFNRCKSNLKALEAGAKGLPLIASKVHPYWNPRDRDYVLFAENGAHMRALMERCQRDMQFTKAQGEALADHVRRNYSLRMANEIRRQVLLSFS